MSFDSAYLRVLSAVLFAAVCAYVGAAVFSPNPLSAGVMATSMEFYDSLPLEGIALRSERVLRGSALAAGVEDGQRLPAATVLALQEGESISSVHPGLFLAETDGFEHLSPDVLGFLDESGLEKLLSSQPQPLSRTLGKIVEGQDWYYAAFAPLHDVSLSPGPCLLDFGNGDKYPARLISCRVFPTRQLLVFRLIRFDDYLLSLRKCSASLVLSAYEGLAVPAEAVYVDEQGNEYVCTVSAAGEKRVAVESIYKSDRLCLVRPLSDGELSEGSRVLSPAMLEDS